VCDVGGGLNAASKCAGYLLMGLRQFSRAGFTSIPLDFRAQKARHTRARACLAVGCATRQVLSIAEHAADQD